MFELLVFTAILGLSAASSIELSVKSKHDLDVIETPTQEDSHETHIDIPGGVLPVYMTFKTQSSPLYLKQEHRGTKGSYQKSDSKDEPHKLVHEVVKPVIQELKEIIIPYRKVIQVIEPVQEERQTIVHKGERKRYSNEGSSSSNGYGNSYSDNRQRSYEDDHDKNSSRDISANVYREYKKNIDHGDDQYNDMYKANGDIPVSYKVNMPLAKVVIIPYRKIIQMMDPVKELHQTIFHKGQGKRYGSSSSSDYGSDKVETRSYDVNDDQIDSMSMTLADMYEEIYRKYKKNGDHGDDDNYKKYDRKGDIPEPNNETMAAMSL